MGARPAGSLASKILQAGTPLHTPSLGQNHLTLSLQDPTSFLFFLCQKLGDTSPLFLELKQA